MTSRPLLLLVSELAALAGRHRYKPRAEAVINHLLHDKVWVKRVREQYLEEQVITQPNCQLLAAMVAERHADKVVLQDDISFLDQFAALAIKYPDVKQEFDALARPEVDVQALAQQKTSCVESSALVAQEIVACVTAQVRVTGNDEEVQRSIQAAMVQHGVENAPAACVLYGTIAESKGLQFADEFLRPQGWVEAVDRRQECACLTTEVEGVAVKICGRIDAIYNRGDELLVVENKNRQKKFFAPNPSYDIDQLSLYILLWDNSYGLLHQYWNERGNSTFYSRTELLERARAVLAAADLAVSVREIAAYQKMTVGDPQLRSFVKEHLLASKRV